ncbi:MAG: hypothetical protein K6F50_07475 [Kiritimatiellae bacterium]|nr:hypothetical protein [Kiritimatiellia bacterium]
MPPENSYFEQLNRIAAALERVDVFRSILKGQSFDFATDDGVRAAAAAVARALGAEVANA